MRITVRTLFEVSAKDGHACRMCRRCQAWSRVSIIENAWRLWRYLVVESSPITQDVPVKCGQGVCDVVLQPGEAIFQRNRVAEAIGMNPSTVEGQLRRLVKWGCVTVQPHHHYSVVRVSGAPDLWCLQEEQA